MQSKNFHGHRKNLEDKHLSCWNVQGIASAKVKPYILLLVTQHQTQTHTELVPSENVGKIITLP